MISANTRTPSASPSNYSLAGKSAIVTGPARGIGRSIAVALATAGADVMRIDIAAVASPIIPYRRRHPTISRKPVG
jgi:hypothetical protein